MSSAKRPTSARRRERSTIPPAPTRFASDIVAITRGRSNDADDAVFRSVVAEILDRTADQGLRSWQQIAEMETHQRSASHWNRLGDRVRCEMAMKQSLVAKERTFGESHPVIAFTLIELASFYMQEQRKADAMLLYQRALEILDDLDQK